MRRAAITLLGVWLALSSLARGSAASGGGPLVAVEIDTEENTLDGCMSCGCRVKGGLEPGEGHDWWVAFGIVRSDARHEWEVVTPSSHCGSGPFKNVASDFRRTVGAPYVVLELATTASDVRGEDVLLEAEVRIRKLSGFDEKARPVYARRTQNRALGFAEKGDIAFPLLIPDEREKESFRIHEVLVRLRAAVLGREGAAAYGAISVSADVPGAEVLLDGGLVGRILEGNPTLVRNVLVGEREIRVRDLSGREARRRVAVKQGKTAEVVLDVLDLPAAEPGIELVPIGKNPQGHEEYWRRKDGAMVVRIPAGEFLRGSPEGEGEPHARPERRIHVSGFLIDKTEVTWRQFRKYAEATGASLPSPPLWGAPDDYPVSPIVWEEAKGYCEWIGGRLPTEAEWEKAARGTDGRRFPWGDEWDHDRCNSRDGGPHRPLSAGSYRECLSPYGVLDMAGSVWEWCADWYGERYYAESPSEDPRGPAEGRERVLRGGAWITPSSWLRADFRYKVSPTYRNVHYGIRCVQEGPE